jgi:hypothetical protein
MLNIVVGKGMSSRSFKYIQVGLLQKTITLLETSFYAALETDQPLESLKVALAELETNDTGYFFERFTIEKYLDDVLLQRRTIPNVAYRLAHHVLGVPAVRRY